MADTRVDCSELAALVYQLARHHASTPGVDNVDAVLEKMTPTIPTLNREVLVSSIVEASLARAKDVNTTRQQLSKIVREAKGQTALEEKLTSLQKHLEEGTLPEPGKKKPKAPTPEAIQKLRAEVQAVETELKNSPQAVKSRLQKQINELSARLKRNDFAIPIHAQEVAATKDVAKMEFEVDRLRKQIRDEVEKSQPRDLYRNITDVNGAYRVLDAGGDFSAVGVQAAFPTLTNPTLAYRAIQEGAKAMSSEQKAFEIMQEIKGRDNFKWYNTGKVKLALNDPSGTLSQADETYLTTIYRKIPELARRSLGRAGEVPAQLASGLHAIGRGNVLFLNRMRADLFDLIAESQFGGTLDSAHAEAINYLVNTLTGHGHLWFAEPAAKHLTLFGFSPRLIASSVQLGVALPLKFALGEALHYTGGEKILKLAGIEHQILGGHEIRQYVGKQYGKFITGALGIMSAAALAGWEIEKDPRASDFGDMRVPGTDIRFNILGPLKQTLVLTSKIFTGVAKTGRNELVEVRGPNASPYHEVGGLVGQFARSKESPLLGVVHDVVTGEDFKGDPVTMYSLIENRAVPITVKNLVESVKELGVPAGLAAFVPAWFGVRSNVYPDPDPLKRRSRRRGPGY